MKSIICDRYLRTHPRLAQKPYFNTSLSSESWWSIRCSRIASSILVTLPLILSRRWCSYSSLSPSSILTESLTYSTALSSYICSRAIGCSLHSTILAICLFARDDPLIIRFTPSAVSATLSAGWFPPTPSPSIPQDLVSFHCYLDYDLDCGWRP